MTRRFSITSVAAALIAALVAAPSAAGELTAQEKFDQLEEAGIFQGFNDGSAGLDRLLTRAQVAKVMTLLFDLEVTDSTAPSSFSDAAGSWAHPYIQSAHAAGYFLGHADGRFGPEENLTLEQLAAVLTRALDLPVSADPEYVVGAGGWAQGYVAAAIAAGLVPQDATDYQVPATREQLVVSTHTAKAMLDGAPDPDPDPGPDPDPDPDPDPGPDVAAPTFSVFSAYRDDEGLHAWLDLTITATDRPLTVHVGLLDALGECQPETRIRVEDAETTELFEVEVLATGDVAEDGDGSITVCAWNATDDGTVSDVTTAPYVVEDD